MMLFGIKSRTSSFLEKETDCLFCGKTLRIKDVLYVQKTDDERVNPDEKHREFMENYNPKSHIPCRRYLICEDWVEQAKTEHWTELKCMKGRVFVKNDDVFQNRQMHYEKFLLGDEMMEEVCIAKVGDSTDILCPHCHCALPPNFYRYKKIRVGLLGWHHSGKSSFLIAIALKMTSRCPGVAAASLITESDLAYQNILDKVKKAGIISLPAGKKFPLAFFVSPAAKDKEPFFLILQDIPGEYTNPENIHHLANDNSFLNQDAFLAIVDINMFVNTDMKTALEDAEARIRQIENELLPTATDEGEKAKLEAEKEQWMKKSVAIREWICLAAFGNNNFGFATFCNRLKSVQIVFTKIDQWVEAAEEPLKRHLMMGIAQNHSNAHDKDNNRIKPATLRIASENVKTVLRRPDVIPPVGDPMGHIVELFKQNNPEINIHNNAYCAIACPPGRGFEGECLNVLDPILNICVWENLLPIVLPDNDRKMRKRRNYR